MRDILFRGKRMDNGEWVEGCLLIARNNWYILVNTEVTKGIVQDLYDTMRRQEIYNNGVKAHEVIPETVGQYTGLKDKNGKRIFEGDIVRRAVDGAENMFAEIINISGAVFEIDFVGDETAISDFAHYAGTDFEVIGYVHDNPQLLEED